MLSSPSSWEGAAALGAGLTSGGDAPTAGADAVLRAGVGTCGDSTGIDSAGLLLVLRFFGTTTGAVSPDGVAAEASADARFLERRVFLLGVGSKASGDPRGSLSTNAGVLFLTFVLPDFFTFLVSFVALLPFFPFSCHQLPSSPS